MITKFKSYWDTVDQRSRRAIRLGASAVGLILVYLLVGLPLLESWSLIREQLQTYEGQLEVVSGQTPGSQAKTVGVFQTVPFTALPESEDVQRKLFWDATYEQLKKAGIGVSGGPDYIPSVKKTASTGRRMLRLKFAGKCKYEQVIKLLAGLNENPYLVSIEEFKIKGDEKQPDQVNLEMVIGAFVK